MLTVIVIGSHPLGIYLVKVNSRKLEQGVNIFHTFFSVSVVNFEHVNVDWDMIAWDLHETFCS